jgi:hypothetical protein
MQDSTRYDLNALANSYVTRRLEDAGRLAEFLLDTHDLESSPCFTFAPVGLTDERIHEFARGGLLAQRPGSYSTGFTPVPEGARARLVEYLWEEVRASSSTVIVENVQARRGDFGLEVTSCRLLYCDDEVYLAAEGESFGAVEECVMRGETSRMTYGVVTDFAPDSTGGEISEGELDAIAESSRFLFVDSYEGGGYIYCDLHR